MRRFKDKKILMTDTQWAELDRLAKKKETTKSQIIREALRLLGYTK